MCTLTLLPKENGFLVGMNRDESLTREKAMPPRLFTKYGVQALHPVESSGGTWIGCNNRGILLALLNWYSVANQPSTENVISRGTLIPELIMETDSGGLRRAIAGFDLKGLRPFRLIGIFGNEKSVLEWRWDGDGIESLETEWAAKHWFSSSLSDSSAEKNRGAACDLAWKDPSAGNEDWLRALHRSHVPAPGPFSVCVHRPDAATVSYTEVRCCGPSITMDYAAGYPCHSGGFDETARIVRASLS